MKWVFLFISITILIFSFANRKLNAADSNLSDIRDKRYGNYYLPDYAGELKDTRHKLSGCKPSISFKLPDPPDRTNHSNNLRKINNRAFFAKGKHIRIFGKIMDENCIPIGDASVEIWHNDSYGMPHNASFDKHFAGNGKSYSNNYGEFSFLTIYPATMYENQAPVINFRIKHPDYKNLVTRGYFPFHPLNMNDHSFVQASKKGYNVSMQKKFHDNYYDDEIYNIDIILIGKTTQKYY